MKPCIALAVASLCLTACATPPSPPLPGPSISTVVKTAGPIVSTPTLHPPAPPEAVWVALGAGVERREIAVPVPTVSTTATLILFRLNPQAVVFRVHYTPGLAKHISSWARELQARSPRPLLVVNAGFFDDRYRVTAFTVADGHAEGISYKDFGGMFAVHAQRGEPRVRSLSLEPWRPDEKFEQAVQGTPVLVRPGRTPYTTPDGQRSRRTAIAQTSTGQIVVVVAPDYSLTLVELAAALLDPELDLAIAVNLDGGSSTGYWAGRADSLESDKPNPAVMAAYPK